MRLILTTLVGCIVFVGPIRADPPCIDGWQTFEKVNVKGSTEGLAYETEEECIAECAARTSCLAVDFNFGRKPRQGKRCWIHTEATLAASPMKRNRKTNHIRKCVVGPTRCPLLPFGPELTPVNGYYSVLNPDPDQVFAGFPEGPANTNVIYTGIDWPAWPTGKIIGFRVNFNINEALEEMAYMVVSGIEETQEGSSIDIDYKFSIGAPFNRSGIQDRFVDDPSTYVLGVPVMTGGMYLQVMVMLTEPSGGKYGLGYRNDLYRFSLAGVRPGGSYFNDYVLTIEEDTRTLENKVYCLQLLYCDS